MICTGCGGPVHPDEEEGLVVCPECGIWYDVHNLSVMRDMWLVEHDLPPVYTLDVLYGMVQERDELRRICVEAQDGLCVVCGHGMYGDAAVHEAIIKRGDLPHDPRVFNPLNCVALHHTTGCHENTKEVDDACAEFLIANYGLELIQEYIASLNMTVLPGRAAEIMNLNPSVRMESA